MRLLLAHGVRFADVQLDWPRLIRVSAFLARLHSVDPLTTRVFAQGAVLSSGALSGSTKYPTSTDARSGFSSCVSVRLS